MIRDGFTVLTLLLSRESQIGMEQVMALTKKQVKQLRGLATKLNPLIQVGKNDLSETAIKQADETIEKRDRKSVV